jgi:hypothetical protein
VMRALENNSRDSKSPSQYQWPTSEASDDKEYSKATDFPQTPITSLESSSRDAQDLPEKKMLVDDTGRTFHSESSVTKSTIGTIHCDSQGHNTFICHSPGCRNRIFGRLAELRRHYDSKHAVIKPQYWCPYPECPRSKGDDNRSFPRKDKLKDHIQRLHSEGGNTAMKFMHGVEYTVAHESKKSTGTEDPILDKDSLTKFETMTTPEFNEYAQLGGVSQTQAPFQIDTRFNFQYPHAMTAPNLLGNISMQVPQMAVKSEQISYSYELPPAAHDTAYSPIDRLLQSSNHKRKDPQNDGVVSNNLSHGQSLGVHINLDHDENRRDTKGKSTVVDDLKLNLLSSRSSNDTPINVG